LPYVLDIDPDTIEDLLAVDVAEAQIIFAFLRQLQEGPPFPGPPKPMAHNAFYAQLGNRWFVGWDFPEGQPPAAELATREVPLRVLGFGRTIRTYAKGKQVFARR
jgi:hypothetical protein